MKQVYNFDKISIRSNVKIHYWNIHKINLTIQYGVQEAVIVGHEKSHKKQSKISVFIVVDNRPKRTSTVCFVCIIFINTLWRFERTFSVPCWMVFLSHTINLNQALTYNLSRPSKTCTWWLEVKNVGQVYLRWVCIRKCERIVNLHFDVWELMVLYGESWTHYHIFERT